jgi:hypothetical protein
MAEELGQVVRMGRAEMVREVKEWQLTKVSLENVRTVKKAT